MTEYDSNNIVFDDCIYLRNHRYIKKDLLVKKLEELNNHNNVTNPFTNLLQYHGASVELINQTSSYVPNVDRPIDNKEDFMRRLEDFILPDCIKRTNLYFPIPQFTIRQFDFTSMHP